MFPTLLANSIAADAGLIPGLAIFGPVMGLPLSVLAAFIERPFFSRAGLPTKAIWYSLQANFVSLLVGYAATVIVIPLVMSPIDAFGMIWPFVALGISVVTERQYLQMRNRSRRLAWGPVTAGNITSAAVSIGVLILVVWLRGRVPRICDAIREYEDVMTVVVAVGSLALFVGSFVATVDSTSTQRAT